MMGVVEIARTGMRPLLVAGSDNSVPKRRSNDPRRPDVIFYTGV